VPPPAWLHTSNTRGVQRCLFPTAQFTPFPRVFYPGSNATNAPIGRCIEEIAANRKEVSSFYLDTLQQFSRYILHQGDHAEALARTHVLPNGKVHFFLATSYLEQPGAGFLMSFRYNGPLDNAHIVETNPRTVAELISLGNVQDTHPSDICFLGEIGYFNAGYVFVAQEYVSRNVSVYHFDFDNPPLLLDHFGDVPFDFPIQGPNLITIDRVDDSYFLIVGSTNWGWCSVYKAKENELFPHLQKRMMDLNAFQPITAENQFPFPITNQEGPSQIKLVRDSTQAWFLLSYRGDPPDREDATDYIDIYPVSFTPFAIGDRIQSTHVFLRPGDTSFANTGTHYVEPEGRLLVSSSYRWAEDEGPGNSGYVHRVDELPSS
jgi:hypothetical protein